MKKIVIFTDLDGTLLSYSDYSFDEALPALRMIRECRIPLVICSSKTGAEIKEYRKKLGNCHPFISENGGGIFIPSGYFKSAVRGYNLEEQGEYLLLRLGAEYNELRRVLKDLKNNGYGIVGFGDMTVREVAEITGLSQEEARMAQQRDFDEPFLFSGTREELDDVRRLIKERGFSSTEGKYHHILGSSDKGKALSILVEIYKKDYGDVVTVALGDSLNDLPMLSVVDYPVLVQQPEGGHDRRISLPALIKADGVGPRGWNRAILNLLSGQLNDTTDALSYT
jgi:mannosyl-3-phosphoglycerate phosphatase